MNTREIATEYRLSHWAQVMQDRVASGMNIKEYCKSAGLRETVYYYWQRKLREAACNELQTKQLKEKVSANKSIVPAGWAMCETTETIRKENALTIEINGYRILNNATDEIEKIIFLLAKRVCPVKPDCSVTRNKSPKRKLTYRESMRYFRQKVKTKKRENSCKSEYSTGFKDGLKFL